MKSTLVQQFHNYQWPTFAGDAKAGLTVAIMLIPQGMAYALLAGLPPIYGLYAGLVPLLIYPFFGSSTYLSVGPVALVSIIVLSGLSKFAEPMSALYIELALITSLIAGVIQCGLSFLKLGYLVNFLSKPVISGFTAAAALIIGLSQVQYFLGVDIGRPTNTISILKGLLANLAGVNIYSLIIGICGLLFLLIMKRFWRSFPSALIVVGLGVIVMHTTQWYESGVAIVETVPAGLPKFEMPLASMETVMQLIPLALIICVISFIESLAIAKTLAARNKENPIDPNKELLGLGLAKVVGAMFQAFPNTGSFTRSAINEQAGAKTKMASIIAAILIGVILFWLTDLFYYLPKAILAAIVIAAVTSLIDLEAAKSLFKYDRPDFYVCLTTFLLTLILGVQQGVFVGIGLSILQIVAKVSKPHFAVLGKMPTPGVYRNVSRYPDAFCHDGIVIFRYDADLFFGNAEHFLSSIMQSLELCNRYEHLILDMSSISAIDSTAWVQLEYLTERLQEEDIALHFANVKGPIRDKFQINYKSEKFSDASMHLSIEAAIEGIEVNSRRKTVTS